MEINVLGPLIVKERGVLLVPSAGKPRQLLALLALRAGRAVPSAVLMEELWGDDIPRSAATTLQTYILQLRRKISEAVRDVPDRSAKDIIATCYGGYLLDSGSGRPDNEEFTRLASEGASDLELGDAAAAAETLARALGMWRGPALADVPVGRVLELELLGMEEARMRALEQRIEADLLLGRHARLLPELRMLTVQHPMHENLCAQLMLALYRSGHTWRALDAFQGLRRTLIDELGVEPSARLQRLHRAVLAGEPTLDDHGVREVVPAR